MGFFSRKKKGDKIASDVDKLVKRSDTAIENATKIEHLQRVIEKVTKKIQELGETQLSIINRSSRLDIIKFELQSIRAKAEGMKRETWRARSKQERSALIKDAMILKRELRTLKEQNITMDHLNEQTTKLQQVSDRAMEKISKLISGIGEMDTAIEKMLRDLAS